jgi:hypothetical protein
VETYFWECPQVPKNIGDGANQMAPSEKHCGCTPSLIHRSMNRQGVLLRKGLGFLVELKKESKEFIFCIFQQ